MCLQQSHPVFSMEERNKINDHEGGRRIAQHPDRHRLNIIVMANKKTYQVDILFGVSIHVAFFVFLKTPENI